MNERMIKIANGMAAVELASTRPGIELSRPIRSYAV